MQTYNRINSTANLRSNRAKVVAVTSLIFVAVAAIAITSIAIGLSGKNNKDTGGDEVSTAVVFGLPLAEYTSILKNCSMTELQYNDTMKRWEAHKSVTLEAPLGTPVLATYAGTVLSVKDNTMYGRQIIIQHVNGLQTVYGNLDSNTLVNPGDKVEKGQQIGSVGQTANNEFITTPNLDIGVTQNGTKIDPNDYIDFPIK